MKPDHRPGDPRFSSGPCVKRPGWSPDNLRSAVLGRSHRSKAGKARLARAIELTRDVLQVPDTHRIAIVPASDTGAVEMALWNLLGPRPVDVLAWESFGQGWVTDIVKELRLKDITVLDAPFGTLPDLSKTSPAHDIVFTWNGTTSGVRVPNANWIADAREGLTICDATSAAFAMDLPFDKLDVVTFSWQKVMGGEAQHGILILSERAVERAESYAPPWPLPKIFRIKKEGRVDRSIFEGSTLNTPSMMAVEDYIDALAWAQEIGGLPALIRRTEANARAIDGWVQAADWVEHLAMDPAIRSTTSICLKFADPFVAGLSADRQAAFQKRFTGLLEDEKAAYDIGAYRKAPPGLRLWAGATVETGNLKAFFPWADWAFGTVKKDFQKNG